MKHLSLSILLSFCGCMGISRCNEVVQKTADACSEALEAQNKMWMQKYCDLYITERIRYAHAMNEHSFEAPKVCLEMSKDLIQMLDYRGR